MHLKTVSGVSTHSGSCLFLAEKVNPKVADNFWLNLSVISKSEQLTGNRLFLLHTFKTKY
jgi:hypothetical protein